MCQQPHNSSIVFCVFPRRFSAPSLLRLPSCGGGQGDWAFYRSLFNVPAWNSHEICWFCEAGTSAACSYKDFSEDAAWKTRRVDHHKFCSRLTSRGLAVCPLFSLPFVTTQCILVDVLHTCDLGITQDVCGNALFEIAGELGGSRADAVSALWASLRLYYKEFKPPCQLSALTVEMMVRPTKQPRLRAKGAEIRHLLPWVVLLCHEHSSGDHNEVRRCMVSALFDFYQAMAADTWDPTSAKASGFRFLQLYKSLSDESGGERWLLRPKSHLLAELLEFQRCGRGIRGISGHMLTRTGWARRPRSWPPGAGMLAS